MEISFNESECRMKKITLFLLVSCLFCCGTAEAGGPLRNAFKKAFSRPQASTVRAASTNANVGSSDSYARALASATARAARGIKGHITSLEMPRVMQPGRRYQSGVGFSTSNPNPRTCLGVPGKTSAVCAVVRGADGWYATCVR